MSGAPVAAAVEPDKAMRLGLWLLAAGNLAWTVVNWANGLWVNVVTDLVILAGCALAATGLAHALDGLGPGRWKAGLFVLAGAHFAQNLLNATDGLDFPDEWVLFAVMAGSAALAIGAFRWTEDGWDPRATPWLAAAFAGIALEPLYYGLRYTWVDPWQGGYLPGIVLVAAGCLLAAWASLAAARQG